MAVSLTGTLITGVPGATSADGISRAAATAILDILPSGFSHDQASPAIEEVAAGIGKMGGASYPQHKQSYNDAIDVRQVSAKTPNNGKALG
jgi:hypothetical protein